MRNAVRKLIIKYVIGFREKILRTIGRTDYETIYFEGGLGSQILSYIEFAKNPRRVDLSYFRFPPTIYQNGPDIWSWELDAYGIHLESFKDYEKTKRFNPWVMRRPTTMDSVKHILKQEEKKKERTTWSSDKIRQCFPIDQNALGSICKKHQIELNKTSTIHIRRGDYERVASRLVEYWEYEDLLKSVSPFIEKNLLFISDSGLPIEVKQNFIDSFPDRTIKFFTSHEISTKSAHDIMRMSKVLITANSTFSISAGLLSDENTIVLSPIDFFGGEDGYLQSRIFNRYGNFLVIQKNS
jgi:hypothetical protein